MKLQEITSEKVNALEREFQLLHLVHHRNKNQHRVAIWWKNESMLHRNVGKVLFLLSNLELPYDPERQKPHKKDSRKDVEFNRKSPEFQLSVTISYILKKVIPSAYRQFHGIVALGQFIPLGITLIGLLSKIHSCLLAMVDEYISNRSVPIEVSHSQTSKDNEIIAQAELVNKIVDSDIGERISRDKVTKKLNSAEIPSDKSRINSPLSSKRNSEEPTVEETPALKKSKKTIPEKASSKEKRRTPKAVSDIDSIFGVVKEKKKSDKKEKAGNTEEKPKKKKKIKEEQCYR